MENAFLKPTLNKKAIERRNEENHSEKKTQHYAFDH